MSTSRILSASRGPVFAGSIKTLTGMTSLAAAFSARQGPRRHPLPSAELGQKVNEWRDLHTGDLAYEYEASFAVSPVYQLDGDGRPGVYFAGADQRMTMGTNSSKVSIAAGLTAYAVANPTNGGSIWERNPGTLTAAIRMGRSGLQVGGMFPTAGFTSLPSGVAVLSATWDNATKQCVNWLNGEVRLPATSSITNGTHLGSGVLQHTGTPADAPASAAMCIGARADLAQDLSGWIYEIWIANAVHSDSERQAVEGQLAAFYGLRSSLPVDHPHYHA